MFGFNVRTGEHIVVSPLTKNKVKPSYYYLICNDLPSDGNFSMVTKENRNFVLEFKEGVKERHIFFKQKHSIYTIYTNSKDNNLI